MTKGFEDGVERKIRANFQSEGFKVQQNIPHAAISREDFGVASFCSSLKVVLLRLSEFSSYGRGRLSTSQVPGRGELRHGAPFAHAVGVAKPQGTARAARGRRTVHLGSMPSSVRRRCLVLYVFSPYLLLSLFLPHTAPLLSSSALSPTRILVGRSLEARMPLRDDRENERAPARFALVGRGREAGGGSESKGRKERRRFSRAYKPRRRTRDYPSY